MGACQGHFQAGVTLTVPHHEVGGPQGKGIHCPGHWDTVPLVAVAAQVLHRGEHTAVQHFYDIHIYSAGYEAAL